MVLDKEKSVVRFQHDSRSRFSSNDKQASTSFPNRQKSDLRDVHRYIPRIHRQQTEQPSESLLGKALKSLAESHCHNEGFYSFVRSTAEQELKGIIDNSFISLSRNSFGIHFLEPIHLQGFAHWQSYPEKRVICFLPVHIPKLMAHPGEPGSVFIKLPSKFQSQITLNPVDLENPITRGRYMSSQRFFSILMSLLRRILGFKSVPRERIHTSETHGVLEIDLEDSPGWKGEVIFCLTMDKSDKVCYCHKPFYNPSSVVPTRKDIGSLETDTPEFGGCLKSTPRSVVSDKSHSEVSIHLKSSECSYGIIPGHETVQSSRCSDKQNRGPSSTANGSSTFESTRFTSTTSTDTGNDITWYACQPMSENNLIHSISITDGGVRLTALLIVFKLLQHDWRLLPFSCYHVQAAMLHETEHVLDESPRWQRSSLESCVRALIGRFYYFLKMGYLPHFSVSNCNLWTCMTTKQLTLAKSALERLVHNDTALLNLVRRTGRFGACSVQIQATMVSGISPET